METDRRSFLCGSLIAAAIASLPGPFRLLGRLAAPRWLPGILRVSTPALRASWPAVAAMTARAAAARAWVGAAGGTAGTVLARFLAGKGLPFWFNPVFRPSLRSPLTGLPR